MREGIKTSEFQMWAAALSIFEGCRFFVADFNKWAFAVTLIACFYLIGRGFFKRSRTIYIEKRGFKTSEFWMAIVSIGVIFEPVASKKMALETWLILTALIIGCYAVSRGVAKGLTPFPKVNIMR